MFTSVIPYSLNQLCLLIDSDIQLHVRVSKSPYSNSKNRNTQLNKYPISRPVKLITVKLTVSNLC